MKVTGSGEGVTAKLSQFLTEVNYDSMPEEVVEAAKLALLDWFGSALRGRLERPGQIVSELVTEIGGNQQATNLTSMEKTSATNAALVNGVISHIIEFDDVHKASILHAAAPVMAAAMATAELVEATGEELLAAIFAGYEVGIRIGEAITPSHYKIWHTTGTVGHFAAAASVGVLLKLNPEEMTNALATAGTQASGLWEFVEDGAMSKHLHPGKAAMGGVLSGLMAKKGFTGAKKIIEGERGFVKATSQEVDWTKITDNLGKNYKILENSYKIHSSCRHTHPAIDVALELREKHSFNLSHVKKVNVGAYQVALDITENYAPNTIQESKFSLPYCVCLAIEKGRAGLEEFNQNNLWNEEIRRQAKQVNLYVDEKVQGDYPQKWGAVIEVELKEGKAVRGFTEYPKGDPENPASSEELIEKFTDLAASAGDSARLNGFVREIMSIEKTDSIREVLKWLR